MLFVIWCPHRHVKYINQNLIKQKFLFFWITIKLDLPLFNLKSFFSLFQLSILPALVETEKVVRCGLFGSGFPKLFIQFGLYHCYM